MGVAVALVPVAPFRATGSEGIHIGAPPLGAQLPACPSYLRQGAFQATIEVKTSARQINVRWKKSVSGNFTDPDLIANQTVSVSFWPNCAEILGDGKVLVAGKDRDGDTRIERWTLPLPLTASTSLGEVLQPRPPEDLAVLYEDSVVGRDMVRFMLKNEGDASTAFVQYYDSHDLYELDTTSEVLSQQLVLSASAEPALQLGYAEFLRGEHTLHGYTYVLSTSSQGGTAQALVLKDLDKDGTLDAHEAMGWEQYAAAGLASAEHWNTMRGI